MPTKMYQAGSLLMFAQGEYSDYAVMGHYRCRVDLDLSYQLYRYFAAHPQQKEDCRFDAEAFVAFLFDEGVIDELPVTECYLGAYSKAPTEFQAPDRGLTW